MKNYRELDNWQIMQATGHRSEKSFLRYLGLDPAELLEAYKKKSTYFRVG